MELGKTGREVELYERIMRSLILHVEVRHPMEMAGRWTWELELLEEIGISNINLSSIG